MATLSVAQLTSVVGMRGGENHNCNLYLPTGYVGPVAARLADLTSRACWNWALCGGAQANAQAATSPVTLYEHNAPIDPFTDQARANFQVPNGAPLHNDHLLLNGLWQTAKGPYASNGQRVAFMKAMGKLAARANGLTPVNDGASRYKIHVTAPVQDWYHWQHWALSVNYNGRTVFFQTEPGIPINWGYERIWEANRHGHIEASFNIHEIHQHHKDVIKAFLRIPRCVACRVTKPRITTTWTRWHRCNGAGAHEYCGSCGYALTRSSFLSRTRVCPAPCGQTTTLLGDP